MFRSEFTVSYFILASVDVRIYAVCGAQILILVGGVQKKCVSNFSQDKLASEHQTFSNC